MKLTVAPNSQMDLTSDLVYSEDRLLRRVLCRGSLSSRADEVARFGTNTAPFTWKEISNSSTDFIAIENRVRFAGTFIQHGFKGPRLGNSRNHPIRACRGFDGA